MTDFAPTGTNIANQQFAQGLGGSKAGGRHDFSRMMLQASIATPAVGMALTGMGIRGSVEIAQQTGLAALKLHPINKIAYRQIIPHPQFKGVSRVAGGSVSVAAKLLKAVLPGV